MKIIILLLICTLNVFSQYYDDNNNERIISLKEQIKESKELRDRVITKRWKDRRKYYQEFEEFKESYQDKKDLLDKLYLEQQRQQEKLNQSIQLLEQTKNKQKVALQEYLNLSIQQKAIFQNYLNQIHQRFPIQIIKRQQGSKKILKLLDSFSLNPALTLQKINDFFINEYNLTEQIHYSFQEDLTLSDYTLGKGLLLNAGTMAYTYLDTKTNRAGILLRNSNLEGTLFQWNEQINPKVQQTLFKSLSKIKENSSSNTTILIPVDLLRSRISSNIYTQKNTSGFFGTIWNYLYQGGFWMIPLFLVAFSAFLFILERFYFWFQFCRLPKKFHTKNILDQIIDLSKNNNKIIALTLCKTYSHIISIKPLLFLLQQNNYKPSSTDIQQQAQTLVLKEVLSLQKYLSTIVILGSTAPLIGLLGTVAGMISLFEVITLYGSGDPKLMAGGISIALITTQTGLAIAVPIMLFHNYLNNRFEKVKHDIQHYSSKLLQILYPYE